MRKIGIRSWRQREKKGRSFEARFPGIDLEPIPGRGSRNVKRITDEHKAGVRYFDLHVGGSQSMLLGLVLTKKSPPPQPDSPRGQGSEELVGWAYLCG
ncbi:MAG: hypothetical protein QF619_11780 [Candidatus Binatia bacterium]|jgi:hypothetical protein|nr:hypothetical protein [Candidatus Binatia bacterium]